MFWHADTGGIDITADIKLLGCTLLAAKEMIAHQKLGVCYCHRRAGGSLAQRVIISSIILGLVKPWLCSGVYIRLEALYCHTHEVAISNQGSIIIISLRNTVLLFSGYQSAR